MKYHLTLPALCLALSLISASAIPVQFHGDLSGTAESPPNGSPGTGTADVYYDSAAHTLRVVVNFSGLLGNVTASHIHAATSAPLTGTAGVATQTPTFGGFPSGVTSGTYDNTFDLTLATSFNAAFITANGGTVGSAEAALAAALFAEKSYLNIHTSVFGGGEIRGFLTQVPDGGVTAGLVFLGVLATSGLRRRWSL